MCLLTYYPRNTQPDTDALEIGALNNSDGHGYAIVDETASRIIVRRSMDADKLIEEFESMRAKHPEGPALFHSRIGTGGTVGKSNCHPFKVGGDPRVVVAHNGILPVSMQPKVGDTRSDTRIFAQTHLPYRNLNSGKSRRKLGKWLGTDKIVVLSVHPEHNFISVIINESHGSWDGNIWYSNRSYKDSWGKRWVYSPTHSITAWRCHSPKIGDHEHFSYTGQAACYGCIPAELPPEGFGDPWDDAWDTYYARTTVGTAKAPTTELATRDPDACIGCLGKGFVSSVVGICTLCLTCQECGGVTEGAPMSVSDVQCTCYVPPRLRRQLEEDMAATLDAADLDYDPGAEGSTLTLREQLTRIRSSRP